MGILPRVSLATPEGASVQLHATWPSSAPTHPFVSHKTFPLAQLGAFVTADEWAAVVTVVENAIAEARPGGRLAVTLANMACVSSLLLLIAAFVGSVLLSLTSCLDLDGAPASPPACTMGKATGWLCVPLFFAVIWLGCAYTPRLSRQWCADATVHLRADLPQMQRAAPRLKIDVENAALLNVTLSITPTVEAVRAKKLADKLTAATEVEEVSQKNASKRGLSEKLL